MRWRVEAMMEFSEFLTGPPRTSRQWLVDHAKCLLDDDVFWHEPYAEQLELFWMVCPCGSRHLIHANERATVQ